MSAYLEKPARTLEQIAAEFDYEARKLREQARQTIITLRQGNIPVWTQNYTLDSIRFARKAHSRLIARREAYAGLSRERDMMNMVMGPEL